MRGITCALPSIAACFVLCSVQWCRAIPLYTIQDLGTLGRPASRAAGVNDAGRVAVTALGSNGTTQMYVWDNGTTTPLPAPSAESYAQAINNGGAVIGWAFGIGGSARSFVSLGGGFTVLPLLNPTGSSHATSINDAGDIVGYWTAPGGRDHAALYRGGQLTDLGVLGGGSADSSDAAGINSSGKIVGTNHFNGLGSQVFVYENGAMSPFGPIRWFATGVNDLGQFVGGTSLTLGSNGFFFDGATTHFISPLPAGSRCDALAVNDSGQVVGRSNAAGGEFHAIVWTTAGGLVDLNTVVAQLPAGLVLNIALGINDRGQIAVNGTLAGKERAYLLTPIPEPAAIGLTCGLALPLALRRYR